ncbi:MAG: hypothetical protein H0W41_06885 [Chloroflexi bacterium]|nr:hypothetical protein [Chloroflexota bacterium]
MRLDPIPSGLARSTLPVAALALLPVLTVAIVGRAFGIPYGDLTRDPVAVLQGPWHTGMLSTLGIVGWAVGAAIAGFAAVLLRSGAADEQRRCLASFAVLTGVLLLDDAFLLHEEALPAAGMPEPAVLAGYAVAALALAWRFRAIIRRDPALFVMAGGAFAVSILADTLLGSRMLVEDGAKAAGIVCWTAWLSRQARVALTEAAEPSAEARASGRRR